MKVENSGDVNQKPNGSKKRKRGGGRNNRNNDQSGVRGNYSLNPLVRENPKFFEYCRQQKIVPEDEFQAFEDTMRIDLPSSFRISRCLVEKDEFVNFLEEKFFKPLREIQNDEVHCPEAIPFVPYAYQTNNSRAAIRSTGLLSELHQLLISETSTGVISRQEAVSMVPPLLLDIQPHHYVLDACASPGSKTMQIVELMHETTNNPEGLLVANDVDNSRCYLLVHQTLKRLPIANCVVINHDASNMPAPVDKDGNVKLFDRVLCDVICSGDGTFRKNLELWKAWDLTKGANLHKLQRLIANRCLELLKVGGLMAYSTCSLNPLEDEAILAHLLRTHKGALELVDVSDQMPELKRAPGLSTWKVFNPKMHEYTSFEEAQKNHEKHIAGSMFPPSEEEAKEFRLDRSFRILPHAQNSGGFFVAILRKTASFNKKLDVDMKSVQNRVPAKKRRSVREDPFVFLSDDKTEFKQELDTVFGIGPSFPFHNLLVRNESGEQKRGIYFVNDALREFIQANAGRFHLINAGVGVLRRVDKVGCSNYRLTQDGLSALFPYITKRIIELDVEDMAKVLSGCDDKHYIDLNELKAKNEFAKLQSGSVVLQVKCKGFTKEVCAWMGTLTVSAFVVREEKVHLLSILGCDSSALQNSVQTSRKEKAQKGKDAALKASEENDDNIETNEEEIKMEANEEV